MTAKINRKNLINNDVRVRATLICDASFDNTLKQPGKWLRNMDYS